MFIRPAHLAAPIAAALLVALTACSAPAAAPATSAPASAPSASASASASAVAAKPKPTAAAVVGPARACALVPLATASKIMGVAFVTAKTSGITGYFECDYSAKGQTDRLLILVKLTGGKQRSQDDQQTLASLGGKPTAVSGIGDSAYEVPEHSVLRSEKAFGAVWGDTYVAVGGDVDISEAQAKQLLTDAHDAL